MGKYDAIPQETIIIIKESSVCEIQNVNPAIFFLQTKRFPLKC